MGKEVVLGTSSFGTSQRAAPVYDYFWSVGGTKFDSAWIYGFDYGPGCCEKVLGDWLVKERLSEEAWILVKGGHTPSCYPDQIFPQLQESLSRLQISKAPLYMLHRDNEDVPVSEFVSALTDLVGSGVIVQYGFSNWRLERVRQADAFARANGYPRPRGVSNQFSLVEMTKPFFPGLISSRSQAWQSWLIESGMSLYPYASQGRGVHGLSMPKELATHQLASSWFSYLNVNRMERTKLVAAELGSSPTAVALAWTLQQPFAIYPIIGPRSKDELADSISGSNITLTPEQLIYLDEPHEGNWE